MPIASGGSQLLDPLNILEVQLGLGAGMSYAALGVGSSAHFLIPAAKIVGTEGRAYAVDILKSVLSNVQSRAVEESLNNIVPVWADLEVYGSAKDIADHSLDCASMINLLYLTSQDEHVFNEANRLMKAKGRIVIVDWIDKEMQFGPALSQRTSLDKVRQMAKVVKWQETHTFEPSPYHFGVVFEKQ